MKWNLVKKDRCGSIPNYSKQGQLSMLKLKNKRKTSKVFRVLNQKDDSVQSRYVQPTRIHNVGSLSTSRIGENGVVEHPENQEQGIEHILGIIRGGGKATSAPPANPINGMLFVYL